MKEIIKLLIDHAVEGYEWIYDPRNGSLWLINPDTRQWLLEYENSGNLWYNWSRWTDFFKYINMEHSEYQQYIQSYVEDVLRNGVRKTHYSGWQNRGKVEDVLRNGVRNTMGSPDVSFYIVEEVLQIGEKL